MCAMGSVRQGSLIDLLYFRYGDCLPAPRTTFQETSSSSRTLGANESRRQRHAWTCGMMYQPALQNAVEVLTGSNLEPGFGLIVDRPVSFPQGESWVMLVVMAIRMAIDINRKFSKATERRLGLPSEGSLWHTFAAEATAQIEALPDGAVVLDLGGGRQCVYADAVKPLGRVKIIAIDISAKQLALNMDVAETRVADVAERLPMPDASADLILSRALLEHVEGVPNAILEMARALRPGGVALHFVPCRYSLFGIAARMLPFGPLLKLTLKLAPWYQQDNFGFPVYYDHCYPNALERAFRAAGFSEFAEQITWSCEDFFLGVYPAYLVHALYEQVVRRFRMRRLAAYVIIKAIRLPINWCSGTA